MKTRRSPMLSRRSLLTGAAAGLASVPLVGALAERASRAETGTAPTRFLLMFTGNGQDPSHWLPSGGETSFTLSPVLEPLAAHRNKLLLAHGFAGVKGHSGGMSETTTGWDAPADDGVPEHGPSIDQFLADLWRDQTPVASLELGVMPANTASDQTSYNAGGMPLPAIGSPLAAFQRVFDVTNLRGAELAKKKALSGSILDAVAGELEVLNGRLGADARLLLDEHLTLVRQQELKVKSWSLKSCDLPEAPVGSGLNATWNAQNENVVTAFRCDVTRVATLRAGGWGGIESGGYDEIGVSTGHHSAAHSGPGDHLLAINRFHAEQLADLLGMLDAVEEDDSTLLDNTVVIWVNELGLGPFNHHSRSDVHVVIAGGKNVGFKNGVYLDVGGVDYQHLLYTLATVVGGVTIPKFGHHGSQLVDALLV